ncbi:killer cell lectin-like receptor subfamily E member 1 [Mya arenaria]|uniref:killer cell lectin-like receptor subfamily E member 1 n=1 Tax=Mya arenaria TaxID=6604 RepID=UPI0022E8FAA7|nr:killer cell lectin-like receptor subfamily E member 1 [Mya arenaria]
MKLALIFAFCFILKVACEGNTVLPSSCASDLATTVSKSLELLKNALGRECPDRWLYFQDSCYLYGKETMKFAAAQKVCEDSDSHLVYINDEEENTFLKDMAREMICTYT